MHMHDYKRITKYKTPYSYICVVSFINTFRFSIQEDNQYDTL